MHAAVMRIELRIPTAQSLKAKRSILKAVVAALRTRFSVSVAEVGFHDLWQRSTLGVAIVSPQAGQLQRQLHTIRRYLEREPEVEVIDMGVSYLEDPA